MNEFDMNNKKHEAKFKAGLYRHYKGNEYQVIDIATHSETEECLVVYRPMDGDKKLWVRPFNMFYEKVLVNGVEKDRFEYVKS